MTKEDFREICFNKQEKASKINSILLNRKIETKLSYVLSLLNKREILSYIPLQNEYKVTKLMKKTRAKYHYQVPFMEDVSFKSVEYRLPLAKKKFNIYEPPNSNKKLQPIDIAIVPVVGVDGDYARIGFGKGMYDRYFAKLKNKPITIFIQLTECFTKESISNPYDIKADIIITPKKLQIIRNRYARNNFNYSRLRNCCGNGRIFYCQKIR